MRIAVSPISTFHKSIPTVPPPYGTKREHKPVLSWMAEYHIMFQLGPMVFDVGRLVAVAAMWLFLAVAGWIVARRGGPARTGLVAVLVGVVAGRAGYIWVNFAAFSQEPLAAFKIWQGGFSVGVGLVAAALVVAIALRHSRALVPVLGALAGSAALWLGVVWLIGRDPPRPVPAGLLIATPDGRPFDLASLKGRPFVVNLWATWCPPCRREMPMLVEVARRNPKIPILFVNQGEDANRVRAFLSKDKLGQPRVLLDQTGSLGTALGSAALPTTLFVGADQSIHDAHMGEISRAALLAGIADLSSGDTK
jgi:cytochrome c biogenesis protein CcmG/thiol:disulfide interchange protein DsbE